MLEAKRRGRGQREVHRRGRHPSRRGPAPGPMREPVRTGSETGFDEVVVAQWSRWLKG